MRRTIGVSYRPEARSTEIFLRFMRPKTVYYAAIRRGRVLPGSVLDTPAMVRRYVRACYAAEVAAGLHRMSEVFAAHGITVEKIKVFLLPAEQRRRAWRRSSV
jgi:hypothetical protein